MGIGNDCQGNVCRRGFQRCGDEPPFWWRVIVRLVRMPLMDAEKFQPPSSWAPCGCCADCRVDPPAQLDLHPTRPSHMIDTLLNPRCLFTPARLHLELRFSDGTTSKIVSCPKISPQTKQSIDTL